MKLLGVTILLMAAMVALTITMDLILGAKFFTALFNAINPFQVMEIAEYVILFLFILFLLIDAIYAFLKKKKGNNPSSH